MDGACLTSKEDLPPPTGKGPTRPCIVSPHNGSVPHALFYDLTHDNESYLDKRSAEDALSTGALMTFSYSAIGSVKGFDDLYPKLLNLVQESRKYEVTNLSEKSGIAKVKRILNSLHTEMALGGYIEGHVHQENDVSSPGAHVKSTPSFVHLLVYCHVPSTADNTTRIPLGRPHSIPQGVQGPWIQCVSPLPVLIVR